jgi:hypothetical protein
VNRIARRIACDPFAPAPCHSAPSHITSDPAGATARASGRSGRPSSGSRCERGSTTVAPFSRVKSSISQATVTLSGGQGRGMR